MLKIVIYKHDDKALVLDYWDDDLDFMNEFGSDVAEWPVDFGIYERKCGVWLWEGTIREGNFHGDLRRLTDQEAVLLADGIEFLGVT